MSAGAPPITRPANKLVTALDDALDLLKEFTSNESSGVSQQNPASLLDQCLSLCAQHQAAATEPIRLLHHFASTGGTLLSKCVAAMPNVQLISELDPLSTILDQPGTPRFAATDILTLMRQSTRGAKRELIIEIFLNNLAIIHSDADRIGQRLVIRDHAHSHFCVGERIEERPTLGEMISSRFPIRSICTVRHPIDSFLSLEANNWVLFRPRTFDEYCKRYLVFLRAYEGVPLIKYESFIDAPHEVLRNICSLLDIPYFDQFIDVFNVFTLTGESGRIGNLIQHRPRRQMTEQLTKEIADSDHYRQLRAVLKYDY